MAGTVGRTPERERYLIFIEPTYAKVPDQVFYLPINSNAKIISYEDLYQFKLIGIERGARVSPRFDQDQKLMKQYKSELDQLLRMIVNDRLEVIAGNEMVIDYLINEMGFHGQFRKASFRFISNDMEYLAISKKSPHAKQLAKISQIIHKMKASGKIQDYIEFYTKSQN
jgi:polar amino acid transport system substrate-binding protein